MVARGLSLLVSASASIFISSAPNPASSFLLRSTSSRVADASSKLTCFNSCSNSSTSTCSRSYSYCDEITSFLDEAGVLWGELDFDWESKAGISVPSRVITLQPPPSNTTRSTSSTVHVPERPSIALHLIPSPSSPSETLAPQVTRQMTRLCTCTCTSSPPSVSLSHFPLPQQIIHLHEDVWRAKNTIVKARILARVGQINSRIYARKTKCRRIDKPTAYEFLQKNHLWGAVRAKFNYGLFAKEQQHEDGNVSGSGGTPRDVLVAVAVFGPRRRVKRGGSPKLQSSHELIRFCTRVDGQVVGGLTKLLKSFVRDIQPDDIVTVVDRDWGTASGWYQLGFDSVHVMPSLVMAVGRDGVRRHLVGAGIQPTDDHLLVRVGQAFDGKGIRPGLPSTLLDELASVSAEDWQGSLECMSNHGFYPVYDVGVERLVLFTSSDACESGVDVSTRWEESEPKYAGTYYCNIRGIQALLNHAETSCLEIEGTPPK
mmetsp:Transcript_20986/g.45765  ORF Transcript_20986/g.45765 Transcript_20986/m.45765 type:complete len:486 (-) Transcript_20986:612-2069(-)|eukprot:CAMPEP_0178489628 /NCGR_PEP_ID=MMETSP0696-20121128/10477_1 /TAXON_ID=265572 /ORGANISM="Extubocellulus spinifer, Strain CCMP396" /LENGTH=485 /DNA_ID=CAMNT_0020117441 /DNA_START=6 /DNA_END=1463 /DNA_ORIENTATION=+